jgi:hypothetical protein
LATATASTSPSASGLGHVNPETSVPVHRIPKHRDTEGTHDDGAASVSCEHVVEDAAACATHRESVASVVCKRVPEDEGIFATDPHAITGIANDPVISNCVIAATPDRDSGTHVLRECVAHERIVVAGGGIFDGIAVRRQWLRQRDRRALEDAVTRPPRELEAVTVVHKLAVEQHVVVGGWRRSRVAVIASEDDASRAVAVNHLDVLNDDVVTANHGNANTEVSEFHTRDLHACRVVNGQASAEVSANIRTAALNSRVVPLSSLSVVRRRRTRTVFGCPRADET